jgi:hypothetical protein
MSEVEKPKKKLEDIPCAICHRLNSEHKSRKDLLACKSAIEILYGRLIQTIRIETDQIKSKLEALQNEKKDELPSNLF